MDTQAAQIAVVGGGLAGAEAAWQAAEAGVRVELIEMRPSKTTPAHSSGDMAELVCSNSLGSNSPTNAAGILKQELRELGSLVLRMADGASLPAGGALAVDRTEFSQGITRAVTSHPLVAVTSRELKDLCDLAGRVAVVATGPLTSDSLAESIAREAGADNLHFYDAAAPIVTLDSVDLATAYWASRYGKGDADYLNCPLSKEQYDAFYDALITAERAPAHDFEKPAFFEGCMPIEQMADRGRDTIRFGPLKPVGLTNPHTGLPSYAVVQLRLDNRERTLLNMVGFQTRLKWGEQERVLRMIPGLQQAEFVRLGVIHRNTYINSPELLLPTYESRLRPGLLFAGQLTGVEGYVESAASGLLAGINAARIALGRDPVVAPDTSMVGALARYITSPKSRAFQPMNASTGLLPPLPQRIRDKRARNEQLGARGVMAIREFRKLE